MQEILAPKQIEFIHNSISRWNLAHGGVRSGKTICTLFRFMQEIETCPDSDIYMIGKTSKTIYRNVVKLLFNDEALSLYRPYCTWSNNILYYKDKIIQTIGAKDEGAVGLIQGVTMSLVYCDEMTLYPLSMIEMINSRLSKYHSMGFASMNPTYPTHILKNWVDKGLIANNDYYSLHFTPEDNPFLPQSYIENLKSSCSGIFYKRNYLGQWSLAEGAIFDFFDEKLHVVKKPLRAAEYWIAGIDVGTSNNFACVLIGINTGKEDQSGIHRWIEKEYVWDSHKMQRQKTYSEYANDLQKFLEPYAVKQIYIDPSAAAFKVELRKRGMYPVDANNDVHEGINFLTSEMKKGSIVICSECKYTIKEIQSYVWHPKCLEWGEDAPLKQNDHCLDAIRYAIFSHKVVPYQPYLHNPNEYVQNRFQPRHSVF